MNWKEIPLDKKLYLFELDDVIYPKRDYLLQIYYLFSQFVEFNEGKELANEVLAYMKNTYENQGEEGLFDATNKHFQFSKNYSENFNRLEVNAHLPLKLLLFDQVKLLFAAILERGGKIAILTKGNPALQLNKLKHIDWQGFDREFKVYFVDELLFRNYDPIPYIALENHIQTDDLIFLDKQLI